MRYAWPAVAEFVRARGRGHVESGANAVCATAIHKMQASSPALDSLKCGTADAPRDLGNVLAPQSARAAHYYFRSKAVQLHTSVDEATGAPQNLRLPHASPRSALSPDKSGHHARARPLP